MIFADKHLYKILLKTKVYALKTNLLILITHQQMKNGNCINPQ